MAVTLFRWFRWRKPVGKLMDGEIPWPDVPGHGDVGVIADWLAASRQGHALADHLAEYDLMEVWNPRGVVPRRKQWRTENG